MKIGNWELRNPLVHYVNLPIEQEMYEELRAHFGKKIAQEIEALSFTGSNSKNIQNTCVAIARGQK